MRVEIDATPLLLRSAGVKNYFYHWIRHLRREAGESSILAFPYIGRFGGLTHENSVLGPLATWPRLGLLYFVNIPGNPAIDWVASRADLFHASNQVRMPPRKTPLTATIHDLTCWIMPELHTAANVRADKNHADRVLRRAVGVIAVSENTKRDAVRLLGLDPETVTVIYSGVSSRFFHTTVGDYRRVSLKYDLTRPYVLFVGTIEPRKNLATLLDGFQALPESVRSGADLVVAGPVGWTDDDVYRRLVNPAKGVRYLGYVPEDDLPGLMAGATVFAYLSLYEGFGFPVAQAMACGVPVVVSNTSSLPEVAGDAGLMVDPRSPGEACQALDRLLSNAELRGQLAAKGRERAEQFRWEECARHSWEFFNRAAGRAGS